MRCFYAILVIFLVCYTTQANLFDDVIRKDIPHFADFDKSKFALFSDVKDNRVRSSMTNNSFDFVIYEDHPKFDDFSTCFNYIYDNYMCWAKKRGEQLVECYWDGDGNCIYGTMEWLDKARSLLFQKGRLDHLPYIYPPDFKYPATALYIASSRAFSTDISSSGSAGLWSCYIDYFSEEYEDIHNQTLEKKFLYKDGKPVTLYSGIQNSFVYNILDENGMLNVEVGQNLTVSGYFSTTTNISEAIKFGKGYTSSSYFPVMLFIELLANESRAAAIDVALPPNGQCEVLFPTNVKFEITDIFSEFDAGMDPQVKINGFEYQINVKEVPIERIQTVKSGSDPNKGSYECIQDQSSSSTNNESNICICGASRAWLSIISISLALLMLCL